METFGIELEVSDISIATARNLIERANLDWQVKTDGTHHVSAEAVSPILHRSSLDEAKVATRALRLGGATVNRQCGLHVHLGADVYGNEGIANLVWNWNLAHATIGALVAKSRLNNRFCVPLSTLGGELDYQVEQVLNGNVSNVGMNGRYRSLNLNAYRQHGTIEFRLHHGTLNGAKVKAWAEFCSALATFSKAGSRLNMEDNWHQPESRFEKVRELLDLLTITGVLSVETNAYLKGRAEELDAR